MNSDDLLKVDLAGWPLPEAYLVELGRLASLWTALEAQLDVCLGKVAGFDELNDPRPFMLVKHSSFPQKLEAFAVLCDHLLPAHPRLSTYKDVVAQLRAAQTVRNRFMHNGMSVNPGTGRIEMARGSARGTLKVSVQTVELVEIRRASLSAHDAMRALHKLVTGHDIPSRLHKRDA